MTTPPRNITCRSAAIVRAGTPADNANLFNCTIATEGIVRVVDWGRMRFIDEVLIADGGRFAPKLPILDSHSRNTVDDVMGSAMSFRNDGGKWTGALTFASDGGKAERTRMKVRDGHICDVSVGYFIRAAVEIPAGQEATVAGRKWKAGTLPLRISTEWEAIEVSMVPVGADPGAGVGRGAFDDDDAQQRDDGGEFDRGATIEDSIEHTLDFGDGIREQLQAMACFTQDDLTPAA